MNCKTTATDLLDFINESPSAFHVINSARRQLLKAGFTELSAAENWQLTAGSSYFVSIYDSTLLAFRIGSTPRTALRIAASHTDFPCLRLKPVCSLNEHGYKKLNVEMYGGLILNTWLDRPLSLAGKVVCKGTSPFSPVTRLLNIARPLFIIPNLAIHMNRNINKGVELNRQKDMLPLAGMSRAEIKADFLNDLLAKELSCQPDDILSYDLTVYPTEQGCILGIDNELISSPRLDNLTSVKASLNALINSQAADGISLIALFDNEEVGSRTKQGAGSLVLAHTIERIYDGLKLLRHEYLTDLANGFMLSVDVAHAIHPNAPEKNDITNKPVLNGGVVLKIAASQSYAGDAEAVGITKMLCQGEAIPYQFFVNRSDSAGGSTLGSISSTLLPVRTMDIGIPMLAMHSARETMGLNDQAALEALITAFFAHSVSTR